LPCSLLAWHAHAVSYFDGKKGDYDKAKELYVKALAIAKEKSDIEAVRDRLEDVETRDRT